MNNPVLETEFEVEILDEMSYAQLSKFVDDLQGTIKELENLKLRAVLKGNDKEAVKYQGYIHNAMTNRNAMLTIMLVREGDLFQHLEIECIGLN
jgi:hypothetical protein